MAKPQKHSKSHGSSKRPGKHGLKPKIKSSKKVKKSESEAAPKPPPPPPPPPELLLTTSQQLEFFIQQYQSANSIQLSSLELESFTDACILKLSESLPQDVSNLSEHMKAAFGPSWKEVLCKKQLLGKISEPGSPALLTISLSALRSLELLRSLKPFTRDCHAAKLFAKHLKIEDQVSCLKNHVNVACGTPSRIKKLIDMEALCLSRLAIVVLDMHSDVKGYSLFSIPQIRFSCVATWGRKKENWNGVSFALGYFHLLVLDFY
ncbi:protein CMSS1 isoform X2 [Cynara cardunculus var. scolymus]|uniref:protein CMSS1 isoform X2 n=1 Tax=Cynara cardunculus var. scolymus TaxID=59895 RepID=UPI000D62C9AA|nr:protein CMSS1 isoform X2 [Cynara cardunculus var. scolymus]